MNQADELDQQAVWRQQARRFRPGRGTGFLVGEVETAMLARLEPVRLAPTWLLDGACGAGTGLAALTRRFPQARKVGFELSGAALSQTARAQASPPAGWLSRWLGALQPAGRSAVPDPAFLAITDPSRLPLASSSIDLVWSALMLHWARDPADLIAEWYRIIRPGGLVSFSCLGVDTLHELRGIGAQLMRFPDMHDLGDALVSAGFAEPVLDTERLTVTWRNPADLLRDLRSLGGHALKGRRRGLVTPRERQRWLDALAALKGPDGLIEVRFELIYGHAWCPAQKRLPAGLAPLNFLPRKT